MTDRINEIDDLFAMFHDFEIVGLRLENNVLTMETTLPWSEMWDVEDYKMTFRFTGCNHLRCQYWKYNSNETKAGANEEDSQSKEQVTTDPTEIVKLELDVQSHDFSKPDNYLLHCNSSSTEESEFGRIALGRIELHALTYQIFDNDMQEITLDTMKRWATEWWASIQKMWDEKK